jgi:glycosyltransferase involved in cell wall biosynthesis
VSTFRRPHYLPGLVAHLEAQDLDRARFEVVLVDNASGDTTWDALCDVARATPLAMCVARVEHNGGPATGRNAAVELARAPLVAFTDDDCLAHPGWAAALLAALEQGHTVVQGRTEPEAGVPRGRWDHTITVRKPTVLFETCNIGYRRADVIAAGGFRPLHGYRAGRGGHPFGGEDTVLGWNIARTNGDQPVFVDDAVVEHRIEPRDFRGWMNMRASMAIFPALIANVPELRHVFVARWFFSRRTIAFDLALLGLVLALALRSVIPLVALLPYAWYLAPRRVRGLRTWARFVPAFVMGDAAVAWSLLQGSIRYRRPLL